MRLRLLRLSFGSARAVKLMPTLFVSLAGRRHRMLGVRVIWRVSQVVLLDFPGSCLDPYPDIGLRSSICAA